MHSPSPAPPAVVPVKTPYSLLIAGTKKRRAAGTAPGTDASRLLHNPPFLLTVHVASGIRMELI